MRSGLALAVGAALISGFSVFLNGYAIKHFDDSSVFTAAKNTLVGAALLALLVRPGAVAEVRALDRRQLSKLAAIAVVGGSLPFILFFEGLSQATAANAAFIHKTLFIWVAILAVPVLGERLGRGQVLAVGLLVIAQVLIGRPREASFGSGEAMIFGATLLWAVETVIARSVLKGVSSGLGATARMAAGAAVLLAYLGLTGRIGDMAGFGAEQWRWLLLTSLLLLAYVTTWYGALKLAPATAVTCVLTIAAPITAALQVWDGKPAPAGEKLAGYGLVLAGSALLAIIALTQRRRSAGPAALGAGAGRT